MPKTSKSTSKNNTQPHSQEIDKIKTFYGKHINDMINHHSKVFQSRFDLHYPLDTSIEIHPKQIRDFSEYLTRDLKRNNPLPKPGQKRSPGKMAKGRHQVDPRVIWVREKHDDSPNCHYHCLALVNGNAKQSSYDIHKRAEKQWGNALGLKKVQGLVDYCDKRGEASIMIDRNQPDYESKLAAAQEQASYLSKSRGKENKPYNLWQVGGTRVPEASKRD